MKVLGIVRRIEKGQILIPKEIRNVMGLEEGTSVELYMNEDNSLTLKKYELSPEEQVKNALENALDFLEELPSPPTDIIEELNKALEIEY